MNLEYAAARNSGGCDDEQLPATVPNRKGINGNNGEREKGGHDFENSDYGGQSRAFEI